MELAVAFIGVPVATYLILAALPVGKPALFGCLAAMAIAALLWVSQMNGEDSYMLALIVLVISAIALAGLVQVLRVLMGENRPSWAYPVIVGLALLCAGVPTMMVLGV